MNAHMIEGLERMKGRPATPSEVLEDLLECNNLGITEAAKLLDVSRVTLSRLVNGRQDLSTDMAQRLGRLFGNGAAIWINLKQQVDLWDVLHADCTPYEHIQRLKPEDDI
jgi:addiction module HigA family antidote